MNTKIRLEGRELITTYNLIIPDGMQCEIDIIIGAEYTANTPTILPLSIIFENIGTDQNVSFQRIQNRSLMTLRNWKNTLGTALTAPYEFAQIEREGIVDLLMINYSVGTTNHLTMQLWWRSFKNNV